MKVRDPTADVEEFKWWFQRYKTSPLFEKIAASRELSGNNIVSRYFKQERKKNDREQQQKSLSANSSCDL